MMYGSRVSRLVRRKIVKNVFGSKITQLPHIQNATKLHYNELQSGENKKNNLYIPPSYNNYG